MFLIRQSLITKFFHRGDQIDHCPKRIKSCFIDESVKENDTESQLKCKYFETLCLGSCKDGEKVTDLPRKSLSKKDVETNERMSQFDDYHPILGEKHIDQIRIEEQALEFKRLSKKYMMTVEDFNTQVEVNYKLNSDFGLVGHLDLFPTPIMGNSELFLAGIDLKLTADIDSAFGDFAWGRYDLMDQTQGWMYQFLITMYREEDNKHLSGVMTKGAIKLCNSGAFKFYFWVFGYKPKSISNRFIPVKWDKTEYIEFKELVRKTMSLVEIYETDGWKTRPSYKVCLNCPLKTTCPDYDVFNNI